MTTRRNFLSVLGGGVILAAGASTLWATTRDPAKARRPWEVAGAVENDPRRKALSFAILAPNPHNRQPWLVDLSADDVITLYCDPLRRLPETDPFDRQITIGLGCFLELLVQASAQEGYRADIALFPDGEPQTASRQPGRGPHPAGQGRCDVARPALCAGSRPAVQQGSL